jgi:hypothetical protein
MYRPHAAARFGGGTILKSRGRLLRDFHSGFLMLVGRAGKTVAGGLVRVDGSRASLTTIGVLDGSRDILREPVSAALDYHLHEWAAEHGVRTLDVGHTRPFPGDGVFYNKRKWQMEITPDADGVMSMALTWRRPDVGLAEALESTSFVYESAGGLGVLCVRHADHRLDLDEVRKLRRVSWVDGLTSFIGVCPGGVRDGVPDRLRAEVGPRNLVCRDLATAMEHYRRERPPAARDVSVDVGEEKT